MEHEPKLSLMPDSPETSPSKKTSISKRYVRDPEKYQPIDPTLPKYYEILKAVHGQRWATSSQTAAILGRDGNNDDYYAKIDFNILFHTGWLDRLPLTKLFTRRWGGTSIPHAASLKTCRKFGWKQLHNSRIKPTTEETAGRPRNPDHDLTVTQMAAVFHRFARLLGLPSPDWENEAPFDLPINPKHWSKTHGKKSMILKSDGKCTYDFLDRKERFRLEMETGTVPYEREDPSQSSFKRHVLGYYHLWEKGEVDRVLFFVRNYDDLLKRREVAQKWGKNIDLFWFTLEKNLNCFPSYKDDGSIDLEHLEDFFYLPIWMISSTNALQSLYTKPNN